MMKRMMTALALSLAMTAPMASAQTYYTLSEVREQAAQGWHKTYTDEYGRTIPVDVDVKVYGEDAVPILQMAVADYGINRELLEDDAQGSGGKDGVSIYRNNPADAIFKSARGEKAMIVRRTFGEAVDMDAVYMEEYGAGITMREMTEHLTGVLAKHGIDAANYLFDEPKEFSVRCRLKRETMEATEPAAYFAHFWQTAHGLPILAHVGEAYAGRGWPIYDAQLVLTMRGAEEYTIHMDALEEMETLAEDVPLCGFDTVKRRVGQEIEAGHVREIFGVRLGYAISNDPENPREMKSVGDARSYYLTPMWVVDCIYMDNGKEDPRILGPADDELTVKESAQAARKLLMINAQTGEMLNRQDKSRDRQEKLNYRGFLSWDEVR